MNRRALISFEMLMWIPRIIFLVIVLFAIIILIRSFVLEKIDVTELESEIFANRLPCSPNSISFVDEISGRVYPGIIDLNKFKTNEIEDNLLKSIYYGNSNRNVGAKITLKNPGKGEENQIFYNKVFYEEKKILVDSALTEGPGGAKNYIKKLDVIIFEKENTMHKGVLILDIIIPNS